MTQIIVQKPTSGSNLFKKGAGNFSIKAKNDTTTDAIGNYSMAIGQDTKAISIGSSSKGLQTQAGYLAANIASVINGLVTISDNIDYTSVFTNGGVILFDSVSFTNKLYLYDIGSVSYSAPDFTFQLTDSYLSIGTSVNSGTTISETGNISNILFTIVQGNLTSSEGYATYALGDNSHAEGDSVVVIGLQGAHGEGYNTKAIGNASHSEGSETNARGFAAHSQNHQSEANGDFSDAGGESTKSNAINGFSRGKNNVVDESASNSAVLGGEDMTVTRPNTTMMANVQVEKEFAVKEFEPALITTDQINYDTIGYSSFILTANSGHNIEGLNGGYSGRIITLHNAGSQAVKLINSSILCDSINRMKLGSTGSPFISFAPDMSAILQYDGVNLLWRLISISS